MRSPGGGELSLSACPGVGNRPPSKKKIANPRGVCPRGMVTGRIEPCITKALVYFALYWKDSKPKNGRNILDFSCKTESHAILVGNVMISMANNLCCKLKLGHSVQDSMVKLHWVIYEQFLFSLGNRRARRTRKRSRKVTWRLFRRLARGKRRFMRLRVLVTRVSLNRRRDCS